MENYEIESEDLEEAPSRLRLQRDEAPKSRVEPLDEPKPKAEATQVAQKARDDVRDTLLSASNGQAAYTELNYTGKLSEHYRESLIDLLTALCAGPFLYPLIFLRRNARFYRAIEVDGNPLKYEAEWVKACVLSTISSVVAGVGLGCLFMQPFEQATQVGVGLLILGWMLVSLVIGETVASNAKAVSYRDAAFVYEGNWGFFFAKYFLVPFVGLGVIVGIEYLTDIQINSGLIIVVLSALLIPQKDYILSKLSFGTTPLKFEGDKWQITEVFKLPTIVFVAYNVSLVGIGYALYKIGLFPSFGDFQEFDEESMLALGLTGIFLYAFVAAEVSYFFWARNYVNQGMRRYYIENLSIGGIQLVCGYSAGRFIWIRFSNWLIRIASAGILAPLATHREQRYLIEHIALMSNSAKINTACVNAVKGPTFGLN